MYGLGIFILGKAKAGDKNMPSARMMQQVVMTIFLSALVSLISCFILFATRTFPGNWIAVKVVSSKLWIWWAWPNSRFLLGSLRTLLTNTSTFVLLKVVDLNRLQAFNVLRVSSLWRLQHCFGRSSPAYWFTFHDS